MLKKSKLFVAAVMLLVVVSLIFVACSENDEPKIEQHDTKYTFGIGDWSRVVPTDKIRASADSAQVRSIYLVPTGIWDYIQDHNITALINNVLKPAIGVSPKVKGQGNFEFKPGVIYPADSLWLVQNGWTVNQ